MGYTYEQPSRIITILGTEANPITVTNANQDFVISVLPAVDYKGNPTFAQLIVQITGAYDTSGGANHLNPSEIEINDGAWKTAGLTAQHLDMGANEYHNGLIQIGSCGNINDKLLKNTTQNVRLHNCSANANNLIINGARAILYMFFE